jgi:hypothetical protein
VCTAQWTRVGNLFSDVYYDCQHCWKSTHLTVQSSWWIWKRERDCYSVRWRDRAPSRSAPPSWSAQVPLCALYNFTSATSLLLTFLGQHWDFSVCPIDFLMSDVWWMMFVLIFPWLFRHNSVLSNCWRTRTRVQYVLDRVHGDFYAVIWSVYSRNVIAASVFRRLSPIWNCLGFYRGDRFSSQFDVVCLFVI